MKLARFFRRMGCLALTGAVCLGLGAPAAAVTYNDFDYITSHVNLRVPGSLRLTRPAGETSPTGPGGGPPPFTEKTPPAAGGRSFLLFV